VYMCELLHWSHNKCFVIFRCEMVDEVRASSKY